MRIQICAVALAGLAGLSACASVSGPGPYETDLKRLEEQCAARGGVLSPTGQTTGRPQTEYVCQITGQPSGRFGR